MRAMRGDAWLKAAVLACAAWLCRAGAASPAPAPAPIARSALVTLEAADTAQGLTLRLQRAADGSALPVQSLAVSIDGRSVRATALADGSWLVARGSAEPRGARLEVAVVHDGIRELLGGELPPPSGHGPAPAAAEAPAGGIAGVLHDHKQLAWWVLNITVVLIAAIALSRRFS